MEQLIEIQKENARLRERIICLQQKLEQSERENMQLRDELHQYRPQEKEKESRWRDLVYQ